MVMADLDMAGGEAPRFKLFGTTIVMEERETKEEEAEEEEEEEEEEGEGEGEEGESKRREVLERKARATTLRCPRCKSKETKFCYFNNYNVNQPRHFCKGCQRYWTAGGTLRNVPVGAGRRKSRPAAHVGGDGACVLDYSSPNCLEGMAVEQWLLQRDSPAKRPNNSFGGGGGGGIR